MRDDDAWFGAKHFGYGAGLPIAWQGWALTAGFFAILALIRYELPIRESVQFPLIVIVTLAFLVIVARHTRGGWRWRWGRGED